MRPAPRALLRASLLALLAGLAGCSRDLDLPTERARLQLVQAFATVAPRQAFALQAAGGVPPYTWAFAASGRGSGPAATVDPVTGAYRAGFLGPAFDLVEVRDAGGAVAAARITVGAPLSVAPLTALVAPNGTVTLLASGGTGNYAYDLPPGARGTAQGATWRAPAATDCWAPPIESFSETVTVHDDTDAPGVAVEITVLRGLDAISATGTDVAPLERLAIVATGGQAPHAFALVEPAFGGTIQPSGAYRAGPVGNRTDTVRVTDANGQQRCLAIRIGPELALGLSTADLRPGIEARAVATGGRAPYTYAFEARGDRSGGRLDAVTGAYLPGFAAGARDLLTVRDAAGAALATPVEARVGDLQLPAGGSRCAVGDVDGDGHGDLALVDGGGHVVIALTRPGALPEITAYNGLRGVVSVQLRDVDLDGLADVIATNQLSQLLVARAGASGRLLEPFVAGGVSGTPAVVGASPTTFVYATSSASIARRDWGQWQTAPDPQVIVTTRGAQAVAAGNFRGSASADVAWFDFAGAVHVSTGPAFQDDLVDPLGLPSTVKAVALHAFRRTGATTDTLLVQLANATGLPPWSGIAEVTATGASLSTGAPLPLLPGGLPLSGLALLDARAPGASPGVLAIAAVNGASGEVLVAAPFGGATPLAPEPRRVAPRCVAAGDLDRDGLPELVLSSSAVGLTEVIVGEGRGRFGVRPHLAVELQPELLPYYGGALARGDLDGDGRDDVVALAGGQRLEVFLGTGGDLAFTPGLRLPSPAQVAALPGDLDGDLAADVLLAPMGGGLWLLPGSPAGDASLGAPVAIPLWLGDSRTPYGAALGTNLGPAALGGLAPGPDLVAQVFDGTYTSTVLAIVRDAGSAARVYEGPHVGYNVRVWPADLDGDGTTDVVLPAASPRWWRLTADPVTGAVAFGAEQPIAGLDAGGAVAGVRPVDGGPREEVVVALRPAATTQVALLRDSGAVVADLAATFAPQRARLARVDRDALLDLVVDDGVGVAHVFLGKAGGGFGPEEAAQLDLPGQLEAVLGGLDRDALLVRAPPVSGVMGPSLSVVVP